jgi:subtilisin family serine protease
MALPRAARQNQFELCSGEGESQMKTNFAAWLWTSVFLLGPAVGGMRGADALDWNASGRPATTRPRWVPGEILVSFREASDPALSQPTTGADLANARLPATLQKLQAAHRLLQAVPLTRPTAAALRTSSGRRTYLFRFEDSTLDVQAAALALAKDDAVEYAEPNYFLYALFVPNDPFFSSSGSWGQSFDDQWGLKRAQLPAAWDFVTASNKVVVAVLDSGIDFTHPDLTNRVSSNGWNFIDQSSDARDVDGHGTFCSGLIAAGWNNALGIAGIGKDVEILPIKVLSGGSGSTANILSGIYYALNHGARVLNMSFGGAASYSLDTALNDAHSAGVVVVAAAGNDSSVIPAYPASSRLVIAVGASDRIDQIADFSNYGPWIDLFAPGGDSGGPNFGDSILSLHAAGTSFGTYVRTIYYCRARGTSFAAPFVCGVVALMLEQRPNLQPEEIRQMTCSRRAGIPKALTVASMPPRRSSKWGRWLRASPAR